MTIQLYLAVMLGGAVGSALRMGASEWLSSTFSPTFPLGTLFVNVAGSFIIGLFGGLTEADGPLIVNPVIRQGVMVGICGGFTTFSSFSLQTLALARDGEWFFAGLNVILSTALCLVAVWLGVVSARLLSPR